MHPHSYAPMHPCATYILNGHGCVEGGCCTTKPVSNLTLACTPRYVYMSRLVYVLQGCIIFLKEMGSTSFL